MPTFCRDPVLWSGRARCGHARYVLWLQCRSASRAWPRIYCIYSGSSSVPSLAFRPSGRFHASHFAVVCEAPTRQANPIWSIQCVFNGVAFRQGEMLSLGIRFSGCPALHKNMNSSAVVHGASWGKRTFLLHFASVSTLPAFCTFMHKSAFKFPSYKK